MIINESGGGAGLNLKVVGGTTQPTSPAENTVWVSTDTEISGYAFSATEPENPTEGMVWFETGPNSTASIVAGKKNTATLYPVKCKQYMNGVWTDNPFEVYRNGTWHPPYLYLYDLGDECTGITGGWERSIGTEGTLTKGPNSLIYSIIRASEKWFSITFGPQNAIDVTGYNTLRIQGHNEHGGDSSGNFVFISPVGDEFNDNTATGTALVRCTRWEDNTNFDQTLDISSLNGPVLIRCQVGHGVHTQPPTLTITRCRLE